MTESIFTISLVGLLAGIIFSMPIAGPVSILITTSALKGEVRFCKMVSFGAAFATFAYSFFAVFGLTGLFPYYKPAMPYLITIGSIFLLYVGIRIIRTKVDVKNIEDQAFMKKKPVRFFKNDLYTGFFINCMNPTLLLGWLTSTFWVMSFVSAVGLKTGGLDLAINQNIRDLQMIQSDIYQDSLMLASGSLPVIDSSVVIAERIDKSEYTGNFHLTVSLFYAIFVAAGSTLWFIVFSQVLSRFRRVINSKVLSVFIRSMGVILCLFSLWFGFIGIRLFMNRLSMN
jgi:threonine/homoserine/homoserine lactone efflux protein